MKTFKLFYLLATAFPIIGKDVETDDDLENCWKNYPLTYSTCLKLCSRNLEPTCLDDQLCYCNSTQLKISQESQDTHSWGANKEFRHLNEYFGTQPYASCHFSDFCEDLCRNDENLQALLVVIESSETDPIISGALCKLSGNDIPAQFWDGDVEACVCNL